jgi:hypothetical protein
MVEGLYYCYCEIAPWELPALLLYWEEEEILRL